MSSGEIVGFAGKISRAQRRSPYIMFNNDSQVPCIPWNFAIWIKKEIFSRSLWSWLDMNRSIFSFNAGSFWATRTTCDAFLSSLLASSALNNWSHIFAKRRSRCHLEPGRPACWPDMQSRPSWSCCGTSTRWSARRSTKTSFAGSQMAIVRSVIAGCE